MSPGGKKEINRLLNGLDLTEKKILDVGCGAGGITVSLVKDYGAKEVIGVDVEEDVVNSAIKRVVKNRLKDKIEILLIGKSNLPFEDNCFDMVFSKDSFVHIPDKEKIFSQVFKVLKPGGFFVFSDWLISHDQKPSKEMEYYLKLEDLGFGMGSPLLYHNALKKSGFVSIKKIIGTNGIKKKLEKNYKYYQVQLESLMRRLLQITLLKIKLKLGRL